MPSAKKPTLNQQEYKKQIKRIRQAVKRLEEKGFVFDVSPVPQMPSRVTKAQLRKIKEITPAKLREKATLIDPWSGNVISSPRKDTKKKSSPRKDTKKKSSGTPKAKKKEPIKKYLPSQAGIVLNNVREILSRWTPIPSWTPYFAELKEKDKNIVERILNGAINTDGEEVVAKRLQASAIDIANLVDAICYQSKGRDEVQVDLQTFSAVVMGRALTPDESKDVTEAVEAANFINPDE